MRERPIRSLCQIGGHKMKYIKLNAFTLDLKLSKNELIVYNYILTIKDFTGNSIIYLSYNQISYETRINRRSMIRTIERLCNKSLIDKKPFKDGIKIYINSEKLKTSEISLHIDELSKKWNKGA